MLCFLRDGGSGSLPWGVSTIFDPVVEVVTPAKLASACFIGSKYKDLVAFMCSDKRIVPMVTVDPRQDIQRHVGRHMNADPRQDIERQDIERQGVMVGAALTMGHI